MILGANDRWINQRGVQLRWLIDRRSSSGRKYMKYAMATEVQKMTKKEMMRTMVNSMHGVGIYLLTIDVGLKNLGRQNVVRIVQTSPIPIHDHKVCTFS